MLVQVKMAPWQGKKTV